MKFKGPKIYKVVIEATAAQKNHEISLSNSLNWEMV